MSEASHFGNENRLNAKKCFIVYNNQRPVSADFSFYSDLIQLIPFSLELLLLKVLNQVSFWYQNQI